jgi:hypothetical protein
VCSLPPSVCSFANAVWIVGLCCAPVQRSDNTHVYARACTRMPRHLRPSLTPSDACAQNIATAARSVSSKLFGCQRLVGNRKRSFTNGALHRCSAVCSRWADECAEALPPFLSIQCGRRSTRCYVAGACGRCTRKLLLACRNAPWQPGTARHQALDTPMVSPAGVTASSGLAVSH